MEVELIGSSQDSHLAIEFAFSQKNSFFERALAFDFRCFFWRGIDGLYAQVKT
jgi:hypothetical protein